MDLVAAEQEKNYFALSQFAPRICPRQMGSAVPRQPAHYQHFLAELRPLSATASINILSSVIGSVPIRVLSVNAIACRRRSLLRVLPYRVSNTARSLSKGCSLFRKPDRPIFVRRSFPTATRRHNIKNVFLFGTMGLTTAEVFQHGVANRGSELYMFQPP